MNGVYDSTLQTKPKLTVREDGDDAGSSEASRSNVSHWIHSTRHDSVEESKPALRSRRSLGHDHIKHRRTRNGCYTCRGRRVKCDEIRPVCERCKKGSRECTYPESRPNPKSTSGSKGEQVRSAADDSHSSSDEPESADLSASACRHSSMNEHSRFQIASSERSNLKKMPTKYATANIDGPMPSIEQVKQEVSLSPPSTETSSASVSAGLEKLEKLSSVSTEASHEDRVWSYLPSDIQYYLDYHKTKLSSHHYFFKHDANHFLHTTLVEHALKYDPLLFAVTGFAAFQATVKRSTGKIQDFLGYYNKSVSLLRKSLRGNEKHTDATMLTILQLATFEDYLGDFVSLHGHQKAACGMLRELYSSRSIMKTEVRRKILAWYSRFDVMGGLMSGYETVLGREWFIAAEEYYHEQSLSYPMSIDYKIEATIARHRLLAADMALLFAQMPRGAITVAEFVRESDKFSEQLRTWREDLDPIFRDESYLVQSFEGKVREPGDIVDPYLEGGLYKGALFSFNFMLIDWNSLNLMHKYKRALLMERQPPPEVRAIALEICRLFEAIEYWPESPPGAMLRAQGSIGLAMLFLPRDEQHIMWCRRKLGKVESEGHVYPATLRLKMAEEWGLPELKKWWLPDEDACPPVIRSVHTFMEDRLPQAASQSRSQDQRNIKGIFSQLNVKDPPPNDAELSKAMELTPADRRTTLAESSTSSQTLTAHVSDADFDLESDNSLLNQSRESFYKMIEEDVESR